MYLDNPLLKGFCFATDHRTATGAEPREFIDPDDSSPASPPEPGAGPLEDDDVGVGTDDDEGTEVESSAEDDSLAARVATPPDLGEVWKQHGIEGLPNDPRQILSVYQQQREIQRQNEEYRQQLQWHAWNQQQQIAAQQVQRPQEKAKPLFNLPEFDREWLNLVTQDENGNIVSKPNVDPTLPQKIQAYAKQREMQIDAFLKDPIGSLQQGFMPLVQQTAMQIAQQHIQQYAAVQELRSFERENRTWVFENGKDGRITPAAETFNRYYAEAVQIGHQNPMEYARRGLDAELAPIALQQLAEREAAASLPVQNKNKDREFIKQAAARQTNRTGAEPNRTTKKPKSRIDGAFPRDRLLNSLKALPEEALARLGEPE